MKVITRFAPSPTGYLHIGGARTALFNWLFARHHGGIYKLRIEDTDVKRSSKSAISTIINGLSWLGIENDGEIVYQSQRREFHVAAAKKLLALDKAYCCYCSPEELAEMRAKARSNGSTISYDRRWRYRDPSARPQNIKPVIRIKMPLHGKTTITDLVQGPVTVKNEDLDDFILLRSDGTPTYMHSVVVDDHDMKITHIIRGDDHLNNAFRQHHLFKALGWQTPKFAHIPLIHGQDGQKLSKRHGAIGVEAYREMGYLPEAIKNHLLRLGWSHKNEEIFSTEKAVELFEINAINRGPSRFDFERLDTLNRHYISEIENDKLIMMIVEIIKRNEVINEKTLIDRLALLLPALKKRSKDLNHLANEALFLIIPPFYPLANKKAAGYLGPSAIDTLNALNTRLAGIQKWDLDELETCIRTLADCRGLKFPDIAKPLRAALTGSHSSPGIFDILIALGRGEVHSRLNKLSCYSN